MGNCDTHLFLGSNSQKTVEYFSKALGEKTISRDSHSVNRDNKGWKTGTGDSDQIMARALLTPDELRRLDNDMCIIYEKGIKPIKAKKYYYFENETGKLAEKYPMSHNDIGDIDRGIWRKYNPYNPYVEGEEQQENTKIESLDDLFEEETIDKTKKGEKIKSSSKANNTNREIQQEEPMDLQKELEEKFDELFGVYDENDYDVLENNEGANSEESDSDPFEDLFE